MSKLITNISATEIKVLLKNMTGINYDYSMDGPRDALFSLCASNANRNSTPCLEWVVKTHRGLLFISQPFTRLKYWQLPDDLDLSGYDREEAEQELKEEFDLFIQGVEEAAYITGGEYSLNIKVQKGSDPRTYIFLSNDDTEVQLVNAIEALSELLPKLLLTV